MAKLSMTPDQLARECADFERKLAIGAASATELGGIDVGASKRKLVYKEDKVELYRYERRTRRVHRTPLLIVYALVNRPYMADLQSDRSLIRALLDRGLELYLIEWGYPDGADRLLGLDDYINRYLDHCVDHIRDRHGLAAVNLLGICQGGTFSVCYSALNPGKVRNLITTVTPIDFHTADDMLSHLVRYVEIEAVVDAMGNIPGEVLNTLFLSLKPFRLTQQKYIDMIDRLDDPEALKTFMRMERWIFDSPALAGAAVREFVRDFYQRNGLVERGVRIGGKLVDLAEIVMPVLNIYARDDHLVPPASSKALGRRVGTDDYTEVEFPGGHIGIYISGRARKLIPETVDDWLRARD
jgi:polyhydroxyalkanoate synthase